MTNLRGYWADTQPVSRHQFYLCGWGPIASHDKKSSAEALGLDTETRTGHGVGAEKICGGGAACELICPVKRLGSACPGVLEILRVRASLGGISTVEELLSPLALV
jgi:hypothetical protein